MIKLIDALPDQFAADCAASVRVISLFNAYHRYSLALFWAQYDEDTVTAVISRMDGDMTVSATDRADLDELCEFIRAVGAKTVLSNRPLPLKGGKAVAELISNGFEFKQQECSLKAAYSSMSTCFDMPDFNAWYADMSHRTRHGSAAVRCTDRSAACALIADDAALIVGLCTHPKHRGEGSATEILHQIMSLGIKRVFVLAESSVVTLYVNRNFKQSGQHYLYDREV